MHVSLTEEGFPRFCFKCAPKRYDITPWVFLWYIVKPYEEEIKRTRPQLTLQLITR